MPGQIRRRESRYNGKVSWQVRVPLPPGPDGKRRELIRTFRRRADAKAFLEDRRRDLRAGLALEPTKTTLRQFLESWLETAARPALRANTVESYEDVLKLYVFPDLGDYRLDRLTPLLLQRWLGELSARGLGARTVRYTYSVLAAALKQAQRWRLLAASPCAAVELPRRVRREMNALSPSEARAFLAAAAGTRHEALFALLLAGGLRPSEALGLLWSDLDLQRGVVTVQRSLVQTRGGRWELAECKTERSRRTVPVPPAVVAALRRHRAAQREQRVKVGGAWAETGLVFTNEVGGPLDRRNILNRHFRPLLLKVRTPRGHVAECSSCTEAGWLRGRKLCETGAKLREEAAAEVAKFRLYDLRHTAATLLILAGVHVKVVAERLGHASAVMTLDVYSHVLPDMQADATDRLGGLLFGEASA